MFQLYRTIFYQGRGGEDPLQGEELRSLAFTSRTSAHNCHSESDKYGIIA